MCNFVHLHNHSEYSILDGYGSVKDMVARTVENGQTALAITDHGSMHGVVEFYRECTKSGIKPIIGCELYITNFGINMRHKESNTREYNHLLLLAQTQEGYKNLLQLSSIGWLEGFYYKPRIDFDVLEKYSKGIIATSGCMASSIPSLILNHASKERVDEVTHWYKSIFGENFYVELQHHPGIPEIPGLNVELINLAKRHGLKMICTNDAHYVRPGDADIHDTLLCVQTKGYKATPKSERFGFTDDEYYLKSEAEMRAAFTQYNLDDSIFTNTLEIADKCEANPDEPAGHHHMPAVQICTGQTYEEYLESLVGEKLVEKFGPDWKNDQDIYDRVVMEMEVIKDTGFAQYYLIVYDILMHAKDVGITWNIRGSGTGSYICYILGMSFIEPIKNRLLFQRFLNKFRVSIPDLDIDFPDIRRAEMVQYLVETYGTENVAQVATFSRMKARMVVRDVGRVLGVEQDYIDALAKKIPNMPGKPITVEDSLDPNGDYPSKDLIDAYATDELARNILDAGKQLEQTVRQVGVHAAAVIISDKPLVEYTGLMRPTGTTITEHITQLDYPTLESLGLLKVDCLGLATMSILDEACSIINARHGADFTPFNIPFENEPSAFALLASGETMGVFQVESHGLRNTLMSMRPETFQHVMDAISLYRPGPIEYIAEYIARKNGEEEVCYPHELLMREIQDTQGIIIYQEQIISILSSLAGYEPGEADIVRKGISKKDRHIIDESRLHFAEGCVDLHDIPVDVAEHIWSDIEKFALYGFNRCISGDEMLFRDKNQSDSLTIRDMYMTLNCQHWARLNGKMSLHYKYLYNGYGKTLSMKEDGRCSLNDIVDIRFSGFRRTYDIITESGKKITVTSNHKFPTPKGERTVSKLKIGNELYILGETEASCSKNALFYPDGDFESNVPQKGQQGFQKKEHGRYAMFVAERQRYQNDNAPCNRCGKERNKSFELHHVDGDRTNNDASNLEWLCSSCHKYAHYNELDRTKRYSKGTPTILEKIVSIEESGYIDTYDVEMAAPYHNFVTSNGIVTCNSHAASYARITMQTAYLKANYPIEYMTACLIVEGHKYEKVSGYISECNRMGINVLLPDINLSQYNFAITPGKNDVKNTSLYNYKVADDEVIRFGLSSIKNLGDDTAKQLVNVKGFKTVDDLLKLGQIDVNKRSLESLVYSGIFESVYADKKHLLHNVDFILEQAKRSNLVTSGGQKTIFKPKLRLLDGKANVDLSQKEFDVLGVWINEHPVKQYKDVVDLLSHKTVDVKEDNVGDKIVFIAAVVELNKSYTKKSEHMAFMKLSDEHGMCDAIMFPSAYKDLNVGDVVAVKGTVRMTNGQQVPTLIVDKINNNLVYSKQKMLDKKPNKPVKEEAVSSSEQTKVLHRVKVYDNLPSEFDNYLCETHGKTLAVYMYSNGNPNGVKRFKNKGIELSSLDNLGITYGI